MTRRKPPTGEKQELRNEGTRAGADGCQQSPTVSWRCCSCRLSKTERALWLLFAVNCVLTVAQLTCGAVANSLSLLGDGALMGMDTVCYAVGIYAERQKSDDKRAERVDKLGALFSMAMLAATTCWVLFDVADRLLGDESREELNSDSSELPISVDSRIMIIFTSVNLVADGLIAFACWHFGIGKLLESPGENDEAPVRQSQVQVEGENVPANEKSGNMNLMGALAHLVADGIRGIAVLVVGILAITGTVDAAKADAYCSLFVCVFVLIAALSMLKAVVQKSTPEAYESIGDIAEPGATTSGNTANPSAANLPPAVIGKEGC